MKILLLGKDGQVGTELRRTLLPLGDVVAIGRSELNLENLSGLAELLALQSPDIIVNAAAYTAVDKAENDEANAFTINAEMVAVLADYAKQQGSLLIHYSTDYVFDGNKPTPYLETDAVNPQSIYGASKSTGDQSVLQSGCNFLIFRTSWVYSVSGKNFIKTILQLAKEKESLRIVSDQHGAPTSAELIADVTALAIAGYLNRNIHNGIYHLTAAGATSWYHLACFVIDKVLSRGIPLKLKAQQICPISTEEYPLPAKRPLNSRLDISMLSSSLKLCMPDWKIHVGRTVEELIQVEFFA